MGRRLARLCDQLESTDPDAEVDPEENKRENVIMFFTSGCNKC